MVKKIIIDTDLVIDWLRLKKRKETLLEKILQNKNLKPLISVVTLQELFIGQSSRKLKEEKKIRKIISLFKIKNITPEIAERAGKILRDRPGKMSFPDAKIAATAILRKAYLATKNRKDFQNIKGLKFYQD